MDKHLTNLPKELVAEMVGREIASKVSDEVVSKLAAAVTARVLDHIEKSVVTPSIVFDKYTAEKNAAINAFIEGNIKMQDVVNTMNECAHDQQRITYLIECVRELLVLNRLHYDLVVQVHE